MSKESDNKAIVGRWFTDFWGKTCNLNIVDELAAQAGRDGTMIERSIAAAEPFSTGFDRRRADEFLDAGVTLFTLEMQPTDVGYVFQPLEQAIAWRDGAAA